MGIIYKSNVAATGQTLDAIKYGVSTAQDVYNEYEARVISDGGVVVDSAKCLAAIDKAIKGGYLTDSTVAVSPMWGIKKSGVNLIKMYSLQGAAYDCATFGTVLINTAKALHAVDTQTGAYLSTPSFAFAKSVSSGCVISSVANKPPSGDVRVSSMLASSPSTFVAQNYLSSAGVVQARLFNKAAQLTSSPNLLQIATVSAATMYVDAASKATFGLLSNGVHISAQVATGSLYDMSTDATFVKFENLNGGDLYELWMLNTSNLDKAKNLSYDQGLRYTGLA